MTEEALRKDEILVDGHKHRLVPLDIDDLPLFLRVAKCFGSGNADFSALDDAGMEAIKALVQRTVDRSMPTIPVEARKRLAMKHFMPILTSVVENSVDMGAMPDTNSHETKKKEALKERVNG